MDDHGFSRTRPGPVRRRRLLQPRQQHSGPSLPHEGREPDRKRKSLNENSILQWMPPTCFSAAAVRTECPSPVRPLKRARAVDPTLCASPPPEFADQIWDPPLAISSQTPLGSPARSAMDGCLDHTGMPVEPHEQSRPEWRLDVAELSDIMMTDVSLTGDSLFSQYLRSPASSCSPAEAFDACGSKTAVATEGSGSHPSPLSKGCSPHPELEEALHCHTNRPQADPGVTPIRLQLNSPKAQVTLHVSQRKKTTHVNRTSQRR